MESMFDRYSREGNEFINELAIALNHKEDTARAGRKLKAVLHAIRNHLTVEESVQMLSQLPLFLKSIFVDKWSIKATKNRVKHLDDFYKEVQDVNKQTSQLDFPHINDASEATEIVLHMLRRYVSPGEMEDMKAVMPKNLKVIFNLNESV